VSFKLSEKAKIDSLVAHGTLHSSIGGNFSFRVIGPCCRLFDREELPWPCSRLAWKSKEPSWRRIGRRFVPDIASGRSPSYSVEIYHPGLRATSTTLTFFSSRLSPFLQEWWYSKKPLSKKSSNISPEIN